MLTYLLIVPSGCLYAFLSALMQIVNFAAFYGLLIHIRVDIWFFQKYQITPCWNSCSYRALPSSALRFIQETLSKMTVSPGWMQL